MMVTNLVTRCKTPKCEFVKIPEDKQEMVAMLQLQEWGMLEDTKCDNCGKVGTLAVETASGLPVTSNFGDDLVLVKK